MVVGCAGKSGDGSFGKCDPLGNSEERLACNR
jgi:hypothetical protein